MFVSERMLNVYITIKKLVSLIIMLALVFSIVTPPISVSAAVDLGGKYHTEAEYQGLATNTIIIGNLMSNVTRLNSAWRYTIFGLAQPANAPLIYYKKDADTRMWQDMNNPTAPQKTNAEMVALNIRIDAQWNVDNDFTGFKEEDRPINQGGGTTLISADFTCDDEHDGCDYDENTSTWTIAKEHGVATLTLLDDWTVSKIFDSKKVTGTVGSDTITVPAGTTAFTTAVQVQKDGSDTFALVAIEKKGDTAEQPKDPTPIEFDNYTLNVGTFDGDTWAIPTTLTSAATLEIEGWEVSKIINYTDVISGVGLNTLTVEQNAGDFETAVKLIRTSDDAVAYIGIIKGEGNTGTPGTPDAKLDLTAANFEFTGLGTFSYGTALSPVTINTTGGITVGTISAPKYNGQTSLPTNAGTYPVTFDVDESVTYKAATGLLAGYIVITKATLTKDDFTTTLPSAVVTVGDSYTATVSNKDSKDYGTVTVNFNNLNDSTNSITVGMPNTTIPTAIGAYSVTVDVAGNNNYNAVNGLYLGSFVIAAAAPTNPTQPSDIKLQFTTNAAIDFTDINIANGLDIVLTSKSSITLQGNVLDENSDVLDGYWIDFDVFGSTDLILTQNGNTTSASLKINIDYSSASNGSIVVVAQAKAANGTATGIAKVFTLNFTVVEPIVTTSAPVVFASQPIDPITNSEAIAAFGPINHPMFALADFSNYLLV